MDEGSFFRVVRDDTHAPLSDHLLHGYESRQDFRAAVRLLVDRLSKEEIYYLSLTSPLLKIIVIMRLEYHNL